MSASRSLSSALGPTITSYLTLKRALGRQFRVETDVLSHLDRFLIAQGWEGDGLDSQRFAAWTLTLGHLRPTVRRNRMDHVGCG